MNEGFFSAFEEAWKKSITVLGGLLGGCSPWAMGCFVLFWVALIVVLVMLGLLLGAFSPR
jgi:hypothetical protein